MQLLSVLKLVVAAGLFALHEFYLLWLSMKLWFDFNSAALGQLLVNNVKETQHNVSLCLATNKTIARFPLSLPQGLYGFLSTR